MTDYYAKLDPFSMVYNALWDMVERNQAILDMIPIANRIKFDEQSSQKDQISDADTPELTLISGGGSFGGKNNSSQTSVLRRYVWGITTGDFRINPVYNRLTFELFRCMTDWQCVLCNLTWCDCRFVSDFRLTESEEGTIMQDLDKGIPGWSALWSCEVDFLFTTKLLLLPKTENS